ncbi:MAG: hypothetical protein IPN71_15260 [Fibrobacteres bacterium]|nr:hypothetical protein [Fibrobacterota bacterium]
MKIHPSWLHLTLALSVLLGSCSEAAPTNPVRPPKAVHPGWRIAEIGMTRADHDSAGVTEVAVSGHWILARTNKGVLFLGREGDAWNRLALPDSTPASALLSWEGHFFVGSRNNAKTFSLEPSSQSWKDLHTEAWVSNASPATMVQTLGAWKNSLLVVLRTAGTSDVMGIWSNADLSNWKSMRSGLPEYDMPIAFLDLDSVLLAATYEKGIYQWKLGDSGWTKAVNPQWQPPYSGSTQADAKRILFLGPLQRSVGKMWARFYYVDSYSEIW